MTPHMRTLVAGLTLLLAGSCASLAPPIRVQGSARDLERLSGQWRGEYVGDHDHRRRGTISFKLIAGEDYARGDVVMTPEGLDQPYHRYQSSDPGAPRTEPSHASPVLTIRFVAIEDDEVHGVLDPYWDPDRLTEASATFHGRLRDNVIEGTFTTTYASGTAKTGGQWKVVRGR